MKAKCRVINTVHHEWSPGKVVCQCGERMETDFGGSVPTGNSGISSVSSEKLEFCDLSVGSIFMVRDSRYSSSSYEEYKTDSFVKCHGLYDIPLPFNCVNLKTGTKYILNDDVEVVRI